MSKPNFDKMLSLIDETFATRNDPGQIQVTQKQMKKLQAIHPATLSEKSNDDGPLIWVLLIPTTKTIMQDFLTNKITETQLLELTPLKTNYDCIYLCSATTLPEARGKGDTKKVCLKAIEEICKDHSISSLFVWPFTQEGEQLAKKIAGELNFQLLIKTEK
jgi:hypothetical protein